MIAEYEGLLGVEFPYDFKAFLGVMNGTDLPTINIYGSCGEPERQSVGVYCYPRDIERVQQRIADVRNVRTQVAADLAEQGFGLPEDAGLVPIYIHRYVMCTPDLESSVVLSIFTDLARQIADGNYEPSEDAVVYGNSLKEYLEREFLMG